MKKPIGVAALLSTAILGASSVLARGGGHAPEVRVPEVREPKEVKIPEIRVPEVRDIKVREPKEVKAPVAVPQPGPSNGAELRAPPTPSSPARPEGNAGSEPPVSRGLDSRAAFLDSAAAIRLGRGAAAQTSVKLLADYRTGGAHCRDYQQTVFIDRQSVKAIGTVCQGKDGRWALMPHRTVSNARGNQ